MKTILIGRTRWLLNAGKKIISQGGKIKLIVTSKAEDYYNCHEDEFKDFAKLNNIKFILINNNNQNKLSELLDQNYDLALSINWPFVLTSQIINRFKLGVVNFHCGDLPKYRGNACPNWAIINNEKKIGLTAHFMDKGLDSGPVLLKRFLNITDNIYIKDIYDWLDKEMPDLAFEVIKGLKKNTIKMRYQSIDPKQIIHCFPRKSIDSKINWKQSNDSIAALIRASSHPFDGAFTFLENGTKVVIWRAVVYNLNYKIHAIPGQFLFNLNNFLVVACGDGALLIEDVKVVNLDDKVSKWENIKIKLRNRFI